jgi:hypothetical protein
MNKVKALVISTVLGSAAFAGVVSSSVSAGCGVSITGHNRGSSSGTINWSDSDVRTSELVWGVRIAGPWKTISNYSTIVDAGDMETRAFVLDLPCSLDREYRLKVSRGGSTWFEYFPGPSTWTRDISPHVDF